MALDEGKRKVTLTSQELTILSQLEHGAHFNALHTDSASLKEKGLAFDDFGRLGLSEAGRRVLRHHNYILEGDHRILRTHLIDDEHVADVSTLDPMTAPHLVHSSASKLERSAIVLIEEEPYEDLPPASDARQKAMRAAGVASGKTGVWVDDAWVQAFIDAFDDDAVG
jgi:hypothetical protein